jgi:hypothetical protein
MICQDCRAEAAPKYRERCPRCGGELRDNRRDARTLHNVTFSGTITVPFDADQIIADMLAALTNGMIRAPEETDEELRTRARSRWPTLLE